MKDLNFKGIKSTFKSSDGKTIYSGQIVKSHGVIRKLSQSEVLFKPDFGFKIEGNNLADAYVTEIVKNITFFTKILGSIKLLIYNIK
jgi:hypothetical protein